MPTNTTHPVVTRKKLIEVSLPLDAINDACGREKSIRRGHPSTLHLWWARRPLASARAVIFSQMVDDPSSHPEEFPTEADQDRERQRLFRLIEQLVIWENSTNEVLLKQTNEEIWKSWRTACEDNRDHPESSTLFNPSKLPAFHDPFAGGGALPLEAQRLGLESYASDLNPVATLINKALIEMPSKFTGCPPINPESIGDNTLLDKEWKGVQGLAEDVRYYGQWVLNEAENRIGNLYPKVTITEEMTRERPDLKRYVGQNLTVIAWIWTRTVKSPNPAFADVDVPLASTFMLYTKAGKEAYVEPVIHNSNYHFVVKTGKPKDIASTRNGTKLARGPNFRCLMSNTPISGDYVRSEFQSHRDGSRMMAIVVDGGNERLYISPTVDMELISQNTYSDERPIQQMNQETPNLISGRGYGIEYWHELFTERQLVTLTTFSDLISEISDRIEQDTSTQNLSNKCDCHSDKPTSTGCYSHTIKLYISFAICKIANIGSKHASWMNDRGAFRETFARQAIPMVWDYVEANPFCSAGGSFSTALERIANVINFLPISVQGYSSQLDATNQTLSAGKIIATDPPYYDNIAYADLSDFFYLWLRRSLHHIFPDSCGTINTPKSNELIADRSKHGSKNKAETFFLNGMTRAMNQIAEQSHDAYPITIYYAYKQTENKTDGSNLRTGWETFLEAVIASGLMISGTWPLRTEGSGRLTANKTNALSSSIAIVCRSRSETSSTTTRREFISNLHSELQSSLDALKNASIAPVDLAQAVIGPGISVYTRYAQVLNADGSPLTVREALSLINETISALLTEHEENIDEESRWAAAWFALYRFNEGPYGVGEQLSKSTNTNIDSMVRSGMIIASQGKIHLLSPDNLSPNWIFEPQDIHGVWSLTHHMIRSLNNAGEPAAAELYNKINGQDLETIREFAYRLFMICDQKGWTAEAIAYNSLVQSWPEIARLSQTRQTSEQGTLI